MNSKRLFAAASAAAVLAVFPAAASAATVTVNGTAISVAGDATDETITIADAGGWPPTPPPRPRCCSTAARGSTG